MHKGKVIDVKKIILKKLMLVLAIATLCCMLMLSASAENESEIIAGQCGANAYYTYYPETDALVFSGEGKIEGGYSEYGIVTLDPFTQPCYIVIEDGITEIGPAFYGGVCTTIYISESVNFIHEDAFEAIERYYFRCNPESFNFYYEGSQDRFREIAPLLNLPDNDLNPIFNYNYKLNSHEHTFTESVLGGRDAWMCEYDWWKELTCDCGFTYHSLNRPLRETTGDHDWDWSNYGYMEPGPCGDLDNDGYIKIKVFCKKCYHAMEYVLPAEPHTFDYYVGVPPCDITEETTIIRWSRCSVCRMEYNEEEVTISPRECEYLEWETVIQATCTQEGKEKSACTMCGRETTRTTDKLPHVMKDWETKTSATCYSEGEEIRYCSRKPTAFGRGDCNYSETRTIPKTEHSMRDWEVRKEATCVEEGLERRVCENNWQCNYEETRSIAKKNHLIGEWQDLTYPTCTEQGIQYRRCINCGGEYEQRYTAVLEHHDASYDGQCDNCGKELSHKDYDGNGYCDYCEKDLDVTFIDIIEEFFDGVRDFFARAGEWFRNLFRF